MSHELTKPSVRLSAAAEMAAAALSCEKKTFRALDVGCDHAKLAVYLVQSGLFSHVTASDVADGPCEKARQTVRERTLKGESLEKHITVVKSDGLCGFENEHFDCIFILGMGGELISDILQKGSFTRCEVNREKIRFILQPMTSEDKLREYLYKNGYRIDDEKMVCDKSRVYAILSVCFDGEKRKGTKSEYLLGKANIERRTDLFERQLDRRIRITKKALEERLQNGLESDELKTLLDELLSIKENLK